MNSLPKYILLSTLLLLIYSCHNHSKSELEFARESINKAEAFREQNQHDTTVALYHKAACIYKEKQQWLQSVQAYKQAGINSEVNMNYDGLYNFMDTALSITEKYIGNTLNGKKEITEICIWLGYVLSYKNDLTKGFAMFQKADSLIKQISLIDPGFIKINYLMYTYLGIYYRMQQNDDKAIWCHLQSLNYCDQYFEKDFIGKASNYYSLANICYATYKLYDATNYYKQAIAIYNANKGYGYKAARAKVFLAAASIMSNTEEAIAIYNQAIDFFKTDNNTFYLEYRAACYSHLSEQYLYYKKDYNSALAYSDSLGEIYKIIYEPDYYNFSYYYYGRGIIFYERGDYAEALKLMKMALNCINNKKEPILDFSRCVFCNHLAKIYIKHQQYDSAKYYINQSVYYNSHKVQSTLNPVSLAKLKVKNDLEMVRSLFLYAKLITDTYQQERKKKNITLAISVYKKILGYLGNIAENKSKSKNLSEYNLFIKDILSDAITDLPKMYQDFPEFKEITLQLIELFKGVSLNRSFEYKQVIHPSDYKKHDIFLENTTKNKINLFETQIQSLQNKKNKEMNVLLFIQLNDSIRYYNQILDSLQDKIKTEIEPINRNDNAKIKIKKVQQVLDKNTCLVNFFLLDTTLYTFLIKKDGFIIHIDTLSKDFNSFIQNYKQALNQKRTRKYLADSKILYYQLIDPVKKYISGCDHLVIIPDEKLFNIPFEMLLTQTLPIDKTIDYSKLDFMVNQYTISYNYSLTTWYASIIKVRPSRYNYDFTGFAPVFDNKQKSSEILRNYIINDTCLSHDIALRAISSDKCLKYLPGSKIEIQEINRIFSNNHQATKVFIGNTATESNFKNMNCSSRIVHIASHSIANEKYLWLSSLFLYNDKMEDGLVMPYEILQTNLMTDLVVLSSCSGARGYYSNTEGIIGLSHFFLQAGIPNVISSMWDVNDEESKKLMVLFYKNYIQCNNYAEALARAKRNYIMMHKESSDPNYWAAFLLYGV